MPPFRPRHLGALAATLAMLSGARADAAASCPPLRWTTLGTAAGPVPTPERSEPANLIVADDQVALVDTGDGTAVQLARLGLDLRPVRTVFISHHHMDHTGGLAAVIGLRWMNTMPGVLTVYGPPGTREIVDGIVQTMQPQARVGFGLGKPPAPPAGSVRVIELRSGETVQLGDAVVTAVENTHFDHDAAKAADQALSFSYRFQLGDRSITYSGDTGPSDSFAALSRGTDLLVSEVIDVDRIVASIKAQRPDMDAATFAQMRQHLATHHITAADLGALAARAGVQRLVLTHFAIPPGPTRHVEPDLRSAIAAQYRGPVELAQDLATFDVGCRPGK